MKKEKGFTLIEIMGAVAILAIMALIVVPLVTSSIKNSKEKLYETQLENIKSSARTYMIDLDLEENVTITLTLEELKKTGYVTKNIKNPKTGEEFNNCMLVSVSRTGEIYNYEVIDSNETTCEDNQNVIMILLGSINETAILNKAYIEPGVILRKENGQGLDTSEIKVEIKQIKDGNIISTKSGKYSEIESLIDTSDYYEYEIKYIYDGKEGRASKTRNVTVKDANNLQCIILSLGIKNSTGWITDNRLAKIISVNSNKKVQYSISTTGKKQYSDEQTIDIEKDGNVTLYGYIKDEDGNESACINKVKYEVGNPSCSINFSGTKMNNNWYISDVVASMNMKLISPLKNQGMSLNNTKNYNGQSSLTMNSSGTAYGYIKDEALKETSCSKQVNIDKTTSILTKVSGVIENTTTSYTSGSRTNKNVQLIGTVKPRTTVSGYSYQWYKDGVEIKGATDINYLATESGNYKLRVTTGSGISGYSNVMEVVIIKIKPTCSISVSGTKGSNDWYLGDVKAALSWNESVIEEKDITLSSTVSYLGNTSINITGSAVKTVYGYVKDEFGQEAKCTKQVNVDNSVITNEIKGTIEGTATPYTNGSLINKNVILTAKVTPTTTVSGYSYQWYKNGEKLSDGTSKNYTATSSGTYKMIVTTGSGKVSVSNEIDVEIDKKSPVINYSESGGIYSEKTSIEVKATDTNLDFIEIVLYKNKTRYDSYTVSASGTVAKQVISLDSDATWVIYSKAYDKVGNKQNQSPENEYGYYYQEYIIDTSVAAANITAKNLAGAIVNSGVLSNSRLSVSISGTSGYDLYYCIDSNNTCTPNTKYTIPFTHSVEGTKYIRYKASKTVGSTKKESSVYSYIAKLDLTKPKVDYSLTNEYYNSNQTLKVTVTEDNFSYMNVSLIKNGVTFKEYKNLTLKEQNIPLSGDGTWVVWTKAYDKAGNQTTVQQTYVIDTDPPKINFSLEAGTYNGKQSLTVTASDPNYKEMYITIKKNNQIIKDWNNTKVSSNAQKINLKNAGTWTIIVEAIDKAGNSTKETKEYKIQIITASCSISLTGTQGSNGWYTGNVKATMTKVGNGRYGMRINGGSWQSVTSLSSFTASSTQQTVEGYVYPYAGSNENGVNCEPVTFKYDNTPPTNVTLSVSKKTESGRYISGPGTSGPSYSPYSKIVGYILTASGTDSESGILEYHFYVNGTLVSSNSSNTYTDTSNLTSGATYEVRVYNGAGLYTTKTIKESCSTTSKKCYPINSTKEIIETSSGDYSNFVENDSGSGTVISCSNTGKSWCNLLPTAFAGGGCNCGSAYTIPGGCMWGGQKFECGHTCC